MVGILRQCRADVLVLAFGVMFLTSVLKKTVLKSLNENVFVFLPFGIGLILYTVYSLLTSLSWAPLTERLWETMEAGFSCGCAATLYQAVYKQLKRERILPLLPILEFLPEDRREEAAEALYEGAKALSEEERIEYFQKQLNTYSEVPMSEEELLEYAVLLTEYLKELGL